MFNKDKPYGTIRGEQAGPARYIQNGVQYTSNGDYVSKADERKYKSQLKAAAEAKAAEARTLLEEASAASKEADKEAKLFK